MPSRAKTAPDQSHKRTHVSQERLKRTHDVICGVDSNAQERIQHANQEQASAVKESRGVPTDSLIYVSWPTEGKASWTAAHKDDHQAESPQSDGETVEGITISCSDSFDELRNWCRSVAAAQEERRQLDDEVQ